MEELVSYLLNFSDYLLGELVNLKNEVSSAVTPVLHDGKEMIASVLSNSFLEMLMRNSRNRLHQLYIHLISIPRQNSLYIPHMVQAIHQLKNSIHAWSSSHLLAGIIGLFVGSCLTTLLGQSIFTRTKYLTPMRAVVAKNDRGVQGIGYFEEAAIPVINSSDDVLIHVKAASLDPIDVYVALGHGRILRELFNSVVLKKRNEYPIILGRDCAGIVAAVGQSVTKFEIGDEVWSAVPYWMTGALAEYVSIKECYVSHKPERLDYFDAASLPYSGCIALDCVRRRAGIVDLSTGRGKRVLVHTGNTAVGCIIIQLCSMYNVSITTSCTSQAVNRMLDAGAQSILLLDQMSPDLPPSRRYDIVFNAVGSAANEFCSNLIKNDGLLIDASFQYYLPKDTTGFFYNRMYSLWLRMLQKLGYNVWKDVPVNSAILDELCDFVNEGKLYPITDSVFNIEACERAFWLLHSSKIIGKSVIFFNNPGESEFR